MDSRLRKDSVMSEAAASRRSDRGSSIATGSRSVCSSYQKINVVTEPASLQPSIASTFSLENVEDEPPPNPLDWLLKRFPQLNDQNQASTSYQGNLELVDVLDNPEYMDTIQSTDSDGSLLRRSMSVPPQYTYKPQQTRCVKEIFHDFLPPAEQKRLAAEVAQDDDEVTRQKWRQTMEDLLENPEYIDSLESTSSRTGLLARTAISIARDHRVSTELAPCREVDEDGLEKADQKFVKNLIVLSFSFMFIFSAYLSLRNLQSSINSEGGLGLYALSSVYASLFVGCICATSVVQFLRPKRTILCAMGTLFIYVCANFYPSPYTLLPASGLVGFSLASLWTAHATYLISIAAGYGELTGKSLQNVISKFNGIFFMFYQISQILGGVISSTVLMLQPTSPNKSEKPNNYSVANVYANVSMETGYTKSYGYCGSNYCDGVGPDNSQNGFIISKSVLYLLVGIFVAFIILGFLVALLLLDPLEGVMAKSHSSVTDQMLAVFRFFRDWRVLCLLALMLYSLLQTSFMFGEFTKSYVTCSTGVMMVGYTMLCMSACGAVSSYINGRIQKYVGRLALFCTAAVLQMILMIVLLLWQPSSSTVPVLFLVAGFWGVGDGIMMTQTISLVGVLFADNREPAFAALKMVQAFGTCINFLSAPYLCTRVKILSLVALLIVAMAGYITMETVLTKQRRHKSKAVREGTVI